MKKNQLKTGMILKHRNGELSTVFLDSYQWGDVIVYSENSQTGLKNFGENLLWFEDEEKRTEHTRSVDVIAVYEASLPTMFVNPNSTKWNHSLTLLWERKESTEMTLAEVCKALGKVIKIVK